MKQRLSFFIFIFCVLVLILGAAPARADGAMRWSTLVDSSTMTTVMQGQQVSVPAYDPEIYFDPTKLGSSKIIIRATLDMGFAPPEKVKALNSMLGTEMPNSGIVAETPGRAVFTSDEIRRESKNTFTAIGMLDLNGRHRQVQIPLSVRMEPYGLNNNGMKLVMQGHLTIIPGQYAGANLTNPGAGEMRINFTYHMIPYTG